MATISSAAPRFKLVFRVPPAALASVKTAIFSTGAGRYPGPGNYTECCWTTMGTGQFRPGDAANPHIGKVGELEEVPEARVETLCVGEDTVRKAVEALKKAHPYEEPGYEVYRVEDI
ncbi:GTP cyclohydrolase 1 type 2/Nif3 [Daldinia loculata]|nr:GTP cyclohydrolase 1 type 2/Nif3 [Daldinia loculata]